jgi:hypothetical protein
MSIVAIELGFALGLVLLLATAFAMGRRLGKRHPDEHPQLGVVQGATLGVMGLLLGFSFSGAMSRFAAREELIVRQANALSTLYLRTQLSPSHGESMRTTLRRWMQAGSARWTRRRSGWRNSNRCCGRMRRRGHSSSPRWRC